MAFLARERIICAVVLTLAGVWVVQTGEVKASMPVSGTKALFLEKDQGELRLRRTRGSPLVAAQFLLKVSPQNNGSRHLVLGSEELVRESTIATHKHLGMDEIVLVESGSVHATIGEEEGDVHAGGLVFIPSDTWVTIQNTFDGPTNIVFLFSEPGFEDYLRCASVPAKESITNMSREERRECAHKGHVIFKSLEEPGKN